MIKAGEHPTASPPQHRHIGMKGDGIEGVRRAAPTQTFGVKAAAGQVIAIHRHHHRSWNPGRKRVGECRLATPGNAPDPDQIDSGTLLERCANGINERCGVIHDKPRMLHKAGSCR